MKIRKINIYMLVIFIFLVYIANIFYIEPATQIAKGTGTVLSDNWFEALTWTRNNTAECAVIATYWDPGHFITAVGRRAVVFDGASQNALFTREKDGATVTTARISDIAKTLYTSSEEEAVEILREYRKPGCDELYYIASADLIGKSQWWTYFATWNPVDKGQPLNYITVQLSKAPQPLLQQNAIVYTYNLGQQAFVIYEQNNTLTPYLQQGTQFLRVARIAFFDRNGNFLLATQPEAEVDGMLWVDPSKAAVVFMQPGLENSLFTRLFFFNGAGLNYFEPVGNWGGEVKMFRVRFPEEVNG